MEEHVGALWHRVITRVADRRHPEAAVRLEDVAQTAGILFRALGGDGGLEVCAADATTHGSRRRFLQRVAGIGDKVDLAWRDDRSLRLPPVIDCFPDANLNRDLYLWLAGLAVNEAPSGMDWLAAGQWMTRQALARFPGLHARYRRLVAAHLVLRPGSERLPAAEAERERAVRAALTNPGSVPALPAGSRPPAPVPLWLHPDPPVAEGKGTNYGEEQRSSPDDRVESLDGRRRRRGERADRAWSPSAWRTSSPGAST